MSMKPERSYEVDVTLGLTVNVSVTARDQEHARDEAIDLVRQMVRLPRIAHGADWDAQVVTTESIPDVEEGTR